MAGMTAMAPMMMASTAMSVAGSTAAARGQRQAGTAAQGMYNFEARQMEVNAGQAKLAASARAREEHRKMAVVQSRMLALAAAGGSASDPSIIHMMSDLEGEKAYRGMVAIYEGEEEARQLRLGAAARRAGGEYAAYSGKVAARGTILSGASSMFQKYGAGGPEAYPTGAPPGMGTGMQPGVGMGGHDPW